MAAAAHQEGNTLYRSGDLDGAEKSYALAHKIDPTEPKYLSNLSAVYYEQGRYDMAIDAIISSWRVLRTKQSTSDLDATPSTTDPMALKMSVRYLKAKLNLVAKGFISLHDKAQKKRDAKVERNILMFCEMVSGGQDGVSQVAELRQMWNTWLKQKGECDRHTWEECKKGISEAKKRLRDLPIYRSSLYNVVQYFRFGHDDMKSLFDGPNEYHDDSETTITEVTLLQELEGWKSIAFLFGGFGDGRQVYATMIEFVHMWQTILQPGLNFKMPNLHLTLFDIHPAAVARVMLVFALIRKSMSAPDDTRRLEVEATLFYLWMSVHIPSYCADIIINVSKEVIDELNGIYPTHLTASWTVDQQTKTRVLRIFEYWSKPLSQNMRKFFDTNGPLGSDGIASDSTIDLRVEEAKERFEDLTFAIRQQSHRFPGTIVIVDKDSQLPLYNNFDGENTLFQNARILLPPKQFLSRHPALENYVKAGGRKGKVALREEVIREWKPNPTLFDNHTTENPAHTPDVGYPKIVFHEDHSSGTTIHVLSFIYLPRTHHELLVDQTAFAIVQQLFDSVRQCFVTLDPHHGSLNLEFVCSELYSGLPKLISGDLGPRPSSFPKKYLRMWLSNTPDYTGGILSNLVYLSPYLEDTRLGMMIWNNLLNTTSFSSLKEMSINYTYLTATGIRRFFNCLLRDEDAPPCDEFSLSVLPRTTHYSKDISKKELHDYLSSILLRAMCCPRSGYIPHQVDEPTNLINFFRLLIALVETFQCPAHWVGDFVQSMINDSLLTTATLFDGILPVIQVPTPRSTERKLNLEPYQLEIETVLVSARGALPFFITYPERFADSHQAIKIYTARVNAIVTLSENNEATFNTANLLFYRASSSKSSSTLLNLPLLIPRLIDSKEGMVDGIRVQIVSGVEEMDFENNKISWKMSEEWYERMKEERWSMIVWVTNRRRTVSSPVPASSWQEVENNPS